MCAIFAQSEQTQRSRDRPHVSSPKLLSEFKIKFILRHTESRRVNLVLFIFDPVKSSLHEADMELDGVCKNGSSDKELVHDIKCSLIL